MSDDRDEKRRAFASAALTGLCAGSRPGYQFFEGRDQASAEFCLRDLHRQLAREAWSIADAMLLLERGDHD
jgi:hypothetical protein